MPKPGRKPAKPTDWALAQRSAKEGMHELLHLAREFFASPHYWDNVQRRILMGRANHVESYLLQMVCGKPKETVQHDAQLIIRVELAEHEPEPKAVEGVVVESRMLPARDDDDGEPT